MAKEPKESKTDIDLLKPVNIEDFIARDKEDCFGNEWDMTDRDCQHCADNELCGVIFSKTVTKARIRKIEKSQGIPMLDEMDFSLIDTEQIKDGLDGMTSEYLFNEIKEQAKASDDVAVVEWIKRFLKKHGYGINNGVIYKKDA